MGGNSSKQIKEKKIHHPNVEYGPHYQLSEQKQRPNRLQDSDNNRPIELSWLQQNNTHDNYNRINHHLHHDEQLGRIPLAINRWPKDTNQIDEQKSNSFIENYIHQ